MIHLTLVVVYIYMPTAMIDAVVAALGGVLAASFVYHAAVVRPSLE